MAAFMDQENVQVAQEPRQRQHRFAARVQEYDLADDVPRLTLLPSWAEMP